MPRCNRFATAAVVTACLCAGTARAATTGMVAQLETLFHNVSGSVTVVDEDTFRVDDFTYDGGGPVVYFYLGAEETNSAFTAGLRVQPLLTGSVYDGTQGALLFDLPAGQTFDAYNAISVWCAQFGVNFGSGTFGFTGDLDNDGFVGIADLDTILGHWNQNVTPGDKSQGDPSGDGFVGIEDLDTVLGNWNAGTPPPGAADAVPEPATSAILLLGTSTFLNLRRT